MVTLPSYATALPPAPSRQGVRSHLLPVTRRNLHCGALDMRYPPLVRVAGVNAPPFGWAPKGRSVRRRGADGIVGLFEKWSGGAGLTGDRLAAVADDHRGRRRFPQRKEREPVPRPAR